MNRMKQTETAELPEGEAIRRAQRGDGAAFEQLYRMHNRRVFALCLRMAANQAAAEDLAQDAFLQLFRKIHTFRGDSAFSTWMHRLVVNIVLMRLRKKSLPVTSLDEMTEPDEETGTPGKDVGAPDVRLSGSVDRVNLERAIGSLPLGYRTVFELHDVQGYEHSEIAEIMGCSVGNSKAQLHKARTRLRELLHEAERERSREERIASKKEGMQEESNEAKRKTDGLSSVEGSAASRNSGVDDQANLKAHTRGRREGSREPAESLVGTLNEGHARVMV